MGNEQFRGLESNQRPPGSGPGVATSSYCPGIVGPQRKEGSRTPKAYRSAGFEPAALAHGLALPSIRRGGGAGFEPAISCSRSRRITRLSHTPVGSEQVPSGSRTRTSAMARRQAAATSWARLARPNWQRGQGTGWDSNPRRRITGAMSSPLDDRCRRSHGTRGARTLTARLRAGYAAANTLIPKGVARTCPGCGRTVPAGPGSFHGRGKKKARSSGDAGPSGPSRGGQADGRQEGRRWSDRQPAGRYDPRHASVFGG